MVRRSLGCQFSAHKSQVQLISTTHFIDGNLIQTLLSFSQFDTTFIKRCPGLF